MRKILILLLFISTNCIFGQTLKSPDGNLELKFLLDGSGTPHYSLTYKGIPAAEESKLGIELKEGKFFVSNLELESADTLSYNNEWEPVWGEVKKIENRYNELAVRLKNDDRFVIIRFRLYDDGLGFRYEFPIQNKLRYFTVINEYTQFNLSGDHKAFWMPGDYDTNEYTYSTTKLSEVNASRGKSSDEISSKSFISDNAVQTPLMLKTDEGIYINIHEAALVNYPAMNLELDKSNYLLKAHLVPDALGNKAYLQTPCTTPWRTIIVSDKAADILASKVILNLNEPSKIEDTGWIKPIKYVGIWWEMHLDVSSWNYADTNNVKLGMTDWKMLKPNGRHGATTANTKRYIDFAAEHGFDAVLVEGWNVGWEDWFGNWKENVFDFITPYPDFDVRELNNYAASKGVKLMMHHETSASATNYERRMDEAYRFMKENGYDAVKTGYVGRIIPRGEHHDGQWMVNHYIHAAEKTAEYKIMLNAHEPVRPTGLHRTYPNWLACEAARGNEFNAWSEGNPPDHETILPFTRLMGGPMDYTPGIFQIKRSYYDSTRSEQVHTTLAKQLALYVTMYSPLQMAADLPENYEKHLDAFQFIKDVGIDWDDTRIIEAEPGDYITIARKKKGSDEWYIGAITDENSRTSRIKLNFLEKDKEYTAVVYKDGDTAHWEKNPMSYKIEEIKIKNTDELKVLLAEGGGAAISIKPAVN